MEEDVSTEDMARRETVLVAMWIVRDSIVVLICNYYFADILHLSAFRYCTVSCLTYVHLVILIEIMFLQI